VLASAGEVTKKPDRGSVAWRARGAPCMAGVGGGSSAAAFCTCRSGYAAHKDDCPGIRRDGALGIGKRQEGGSSLRLEASLQPAPPA
jgi:hypothetical protein